MRTLPLLLLAACAVEADPILGLPGDAQAPPPVIDVSAVVPGQVMVASVSGPPTGTSIGLRASDAWEPGGCPSTLFNTCLEVGGPGTNSVSGTSVVQRGSAVIARSVPRSLPEGLDVFVQLAGQTPGGAVGTSDVFLRVVGCGDGVLGATETCDDGNLVDGDGCSATCDMEPETIMLSSGIRFGFCFGDCRFALEYAGDTVTFEVSDYQGTTPTLQNTGTLTDVGLRRRNQILSALDGVRLQPVYGCPDCFDQGSIFFELVQGGVQQRVRVDPTTVPAVLEDLDTWRQDLSLALSACDPNPWVVPDTTCMPQP